MSEENKEVKVEKKEEVKTRPIAIITHAFNIVNYPVYFNHLYSIATWGKKYDLAFIGKDGLQSAAAREGLFDEAVKLNCSHALILDVDHIIPKNLLDLLWETKDAAMVSGLVCKKGEGFPQISFNQGKDGLFGSPQFPLDGRIYQVDICAFGCTLINLDKLKKLKRPWFRDECRPLANGELGNVRSDVNLCLAFKEIGETCFVDTRALIGHHGRFVTIFPQNAKTVDKCVSLIFDDILLKENQRGHYEATL